MNNIEQKKLKLSLLETFVRVLAGKEKSLIFLYKNAYILRDDTYISQMGHSNIIFKFKNENEQFMYVVEGDYSYDDKLTIEENDKLRKIFLSSIEKMQKGIEMSRETIKALEKKIENLSVD